MMIQVTAILLLQSLVAQGSFSGLADQFPAPPVDPKTLGKWMPDSQSERCLVKAAGCYGTFSWYWNRRHHCRQCGVLACHACVPVTTLPKAGEYLRDEKRKIRTNQVRLCKKCVKIIDKENFREDLIYGNSKNAQQLLTKSHWVLKRSDNSILDNALKQITYDENTSRLFSVIISPRKRPCYLSTLFSTPKVAYNRINQDEKSEDFWRKLNKDMKRTYKFGYYQGMTCGPYALLFALIELESPLFTVPRLEEAFDSIFTSIRKEQAENDPIYKVVEKMYPGKAMAHTGTYPSGLLKTINTNEWCQGFTARIEVRRDGLEKFPVLKNCVANWGATPVNTFTKPKSYERALEWIVPDGQLSYLSS